MSSFNIVIQVFIVFLRFIEFGMLGSIELKKICQSLLQSSVEIK